MRTALLGLTLLLLAAGCDTNGPVAVTTMPAAPEFEETVFGTENYDAGRALLLTEGGLLVAGAANGVVAPADGTLPTPSLSLLDATGTVRWTRAYDDLRYGTARAVLPAGANGFVLLADLHDLFFQDRRVALWRVDADGHFLQSLFERPNGTVYFSATRPLISTRGGGFLLIGNDYPVEGPTIPFIVHLNADGTVQWTRELTENANLNAALQTEDGGFVALGTSLNDTPDFDQQILLVRLNADGTVRWTRTLGAPDRVERATALVAATDDGFLLAGNRDASGDDAAELVPFALRVTADGTPVWDRSYHPADVSSSMTQGLGRTPDGGYALSGWTTTVQNTTDAFVIKITATGEHQWTRLLSTASTITQGYDLLALPNGRLVLTGARGPDTPTFGGADFDVVVWTLGM